MPEPERPLLRRLAWLAFAAATLWLFTGILRQAVDPQNRALKADDSLDAERLRALAEVVPTDPVVLLAFTTAGDLPMLPADRERLGKLPAELVKLPFVVTAEVAPIDDRGLVLIPVSIRGNEALAIAEAVVAKAKAAAPASLQVLATGLPLLEGTIAHLVAGERHRIVPLLVLVLLLSAFFFYRRLALAIAVLLPPLVAIAWTGGSIAWLGHPLDPVAALLDPVLLTIGVASSVHFVESFRFALASGDSADAAARAAALAMRTPALLATATTMIGLWSLTTSAIPAVFDFGLRSAMGVALTHGFTFLLLPPFLAKFARKTQPAVSGTFGRAWLIGVRHHRTALLVTTGAITALATAGLTLLTTDNDPLRLLPSQEAARRDHDVLAQRLGGVETFHLLVPARSAASEPARLLPLLAELRTTPGIVGLAGPVQRGVEGDLAVPFLLAPGGSGVREPLFAACERMTAVLGLDEVVPVGASVQIARDSHRLMQSLVGSLGISLVLLAIAMVIGLRSWRLGVIGMLPNLLPALWLYGGLGWLARPVSVATAMIGCTMLGLIVDNTLHLLHHYQNERRTQTKAMAMHHAFLRCGRAMTLATVVLMLGFGTAACSRLATTVEFGLLATATIAAAWFGTAVVLPLLFFGNTTSDDAILEQHEH